MAKFRQRVGAYSRGALINYFSSKRGRLFEALRYILIGKDS